MQKEFKYSFKSPGQDALTLTVTNAGMQQCEPCHSWGPGVRTQYLIHHIVSGKGEYTTGGRSYQLHSGDTFLIYPDEEISYKADGEEPWEYVWAGFTGANAAKMIAHTGFSKQCPVISTDFGDRLKKAISKIYHARGEDMASKTRMSGNMFLMLAILMESGSSDSPGSGTADYARCAAEYIRFNYAQDLSVETIARHIGISRSHLYRAFTAEYAASPKEYLTDIRICAACDLLDKTRLSVGAVANSVGFADHLYFSTVFKKIKGVTPTQYRKQ